MTWNNIVHNDIQFIICIVCVNIAYTVVHCVMKYSCQVLHKFCILHLLAWIWPEVLNFWYENILHIIGHNIGMDQCESSYSSWARLAARWATGNSEMGPAGKEITIPKMFNVRSQSLQAVQHWFKGGLKGHQYKMSWDFCAKAGSTSKKENAGIFSK
jgi:hypothetical protein